MSKIQRAASIGLGCLFGFTLAACGGGGGGSSAGTDTRAPVAATLSRAADCQELHAAIRTDARDKIRVQAHALRERGWWYSGGGEPAPSATLAPGAQATPAPGGGPSRDATDTNTQVPGVDEADIVEIDGERLFLLRSTELLVLPVSSPEATTIGERIAIEGFPIGMFVTDGRALVASSVFDAGPLGGESRCTAIGTPFPTSPMFEGDVGLPLEPPCFSSFTKVTLLDLAASPARVARELYIEGSYVSARRHGTRARVIVQRDWGTPPGVVDPWQVVWSPTPPSSETDFVARVDAWEAQALAAIDASALADWLPAVRERVDATIVDRPLDCTATHVAPPGHAQHGTTLIVGLDLAADDAPLADTTLLGAGSHVYANGDSLVLAYPDWQVEPIGEATTRTALHVFALPADSLETVYRGSGFVPGSVLSQFSIDVRDDVIRVATGYARKLDGQNVTRVLTTRIAEGALETLGTTGDIAPGEFLQSARFLGDRAYVVTFLRIDPLFVIDLANPAAPTILGEVEIPGFSEYLHPLDQTHLLTIGQDALGGLAIKIFDVGEPTAPRVVDGYDFGSDAWSPAQGNHLAFTYDARLGLLALPVNRYGDDAVLTLFGIDAATGITLRGAVAHEGIPDPCAPPLDFEVCLGPSTWMERGLFISDAVYSLSTHALKVHRLDDLATPLATVSLP